MTQVKHVDPYTLVYVRALEVTKPLVVSCCGEWLTIMNTGYFWLTVLEARARHVTTFHCDAAGGLVQIYVDIIEAWNVGVDGFPQFMDLYLDVIATPDGRAEIIDTEELEAALEAGLVTRAQYEHAWAEARGVAAAIREGTFAPLEWARGSGMIRRSPAEVGDPRRRFPGGQ